MSTKKDYQFSWDPVSANTVFNYIKCNNCSILILSNNKDFKAAHQKTCWRNIK